MPPPATRKRALGPGAGIAALATADSGRLARPGGRPSLCPGADGVGSASRRSVRLPRRVAGEAKGGEVAVREAGVVLDMVMEWKLCEVAVVVLQRRRRVAEAVARVNLSCQLRSSFGLTGELGLEERKARRSLCSNRSRCVSMDAPCRAAR
jgi:hypothetical protein